MHGFTLPGRKVGLTRRTKITQASHAFIAMESSSEKPSIQILTCKAATVSGIDLPSICLVCMSQGDPSPPAASIDGPAPGVPSKDSADDDDDDMCRFKDFRILQLGRKGRMRTVGFQETHLPYKSFIYDTTFHPLPKKSALEDVQYAIASGLKGYLETELRVAESPVVIRKAAETEHLLRCDHCNQAILFSSFLCRVCGIEVCQDCHDKRKQWKGQHINCLHQFHGCIREQPERLRKVLTDISAVIASHPTKTPRFQVKAAEALMQASKVSGEIPSVCASQEDLFYNLWEAGESVLVYLRQPMDPVWAPRTLRETYGRQEIETIEVNEDGSSTTKNMTVQAFFDLFSSHDPEQSTWSLKIKDWPTKASFESVWTTENRSFLAALPYKTITHPNGCYNIAAHFARDSTDMSAHRPDLGPKLYIATGDGTGHGTTILHLDVTSAVNILMFEQNVRRPGAEWLIFRREDTPRLRQYLIEECNYKNGDPIHDHGYFLTKDHLIALKKKGVHPHHFVQRQGQAVFINAGCAHQVRNLGGCIKVAVDFLDASSLPGTLLVNQDMQKQHMEDILLLKHSLWHAWHSISSKLITGEGLLLRTRKQQHTFQQHNSDKGKDKKAHRKQALAVSTGGTTREAIRAKYLHRCPDPGCKGKNRTFPIPGIFAHIASIHKFTLTEDEKKILSETPSSEWANRYKELLVKY